MPEFALQMRQISKTYGPVRANDSITFQVKPGTIHAIAGENGAGKSTLMKILFGLVEPDAFDGDGGIFLAGNKTRFHSPLDAISKGIGMVQQHFAIAGALTALENIILGAEPLAAPGIVDRKEAQAILEKLAGQNLSLPWNEEASGLSVGYQQRIEILKLLFRKAEILILDEPTAVLTPQEVETFFGLLKTLRSQGKTIILITHKLNEVLSLCDAVTVLRQGKVTGDFSTQGLTKEQLIRAMIGRDIVSPPKEKPNPGAVLVLAKNLRVEKVLRGSLRGLDLEVRENEIVGVAGVEGHGQGALVEALLALSAYTGNLTFKGKPFELSTEAIRKNLNVGLISEDRHNQSLWLDATIAENCAIGFLERHRKFGQSFGQSFGWLSSKSMTTAAEKVLAPYGVKMASVNAKMSSLSGGNQQKVVVAREVSQRQPKFLIASQPTRGVDVGAIEFIHQQIRSLKKSGAGILLISSELDELCELSDRIVVLFEGRSVATFTGPNYDLNSIGRAMTSGVAQ